MSKTVRSLVVYLSGAAILTGAMVLISHFYLKEEIMKVFVCFIVILTPLVFLNKWVGFLFLPVLVGSFFMMGYYQRWFWEKESLKHYKDVEITSLIHLPDSFPPLARYKFAENIRPEMKSGYTILQYDKMDEDNLTGHGMLLGKRNYYVLRENRASNDTAKIPVRFFCLLETGGAGDLTEVEFSNLIHVKGVGYGVSLPFTGMDTAAIVTMITKYNLEVGKDIQLIRWGDPEREVARLWKKVWLTFLFAHLGWLILFAIHIYEPESPDSDTDQLLDKEW